MWTWRLVLEKGSIILFWAGTLGIALKFLTFQILLNMGLSNGDLLTGLWFPFFPNVLDSLFLVLGASYLAYNGLKKK